MKRLFLGLALLLVPTLVYAQLPESGILNAASSACATANSCVTLPLNGNNGGASIQLVGTSTQTANFEATADGSNWAAIVGTPVAGGAGVSSATAAGTWQFGTAGLTGLRARTFPYTSGAFQVTIQPSAAAPSSSSSTVTGEVEITGDALTALEAIQAEVESTDPVGVNIQATTTGGWLAFNATAADGATACTNSAQAVKASAGNVGGWLLNNPNTADSWLQFYNVAQGSVTVGTTVPYATLRIPGVATNSVATNFEIVTGLSFSTAISMACTSTAGGNGAPTNAVEITVLYK